MDRPDSYTLPRPAHTDDLQSDIAALRSDIARMFRETTIHLTGMHVISMTTIVVILMSCR